MSNEAIGEALESWVNGLPSEDGESVGVLGDWVAVVAMVDIGSEGQPVCNYYVAVKGGSMLPHVANGLLSRGMDELAELENDDG